MAEAEHWFLLAEIRFDGQRSFAKTCLWPKAFTTKQERSRIAALELTEAGAALSLSELVGLCMQGKLDEVYMIPSKPPLKKEGEKIAPKYREPRVMVPTPIGAAYEVGQFVRSLGPEEISEETQMRAKVNTMDAERAWRAK